MDKGHAKLSKLTNIVLGVTQTHFPELLIIFYISSVFKKTLTQNIV